MNVEPAFEQFAAAYAAGRPQVVWTRLIADLETPVSAMLKLADGRPNAFLLESVEGGAVARPLFAHRAQARPDLALPRRQGGDQPRAPASTPDASSRRRTARWTVLRALIAESRIDAAARPAADGGRPVRLSRLRHGPAGGAPAGRRTRTRSACPTAILLRPTVIAIFDTVEDMITVVTPVRPDAGVDAARRLRPGAGAAGRRRRRLRPQPAAPARRPADAADLPEPTSNMTPEAVSRAWSRSAKEYIRAGDIFQVVPSQRFQRAVPAAARSRSTARCGGSTPRPSCSFSTSAASRRRLQPGDPGAAARRQGHHPPARRHPAARRDAGGRPRAGRRAAGRPEGAGRAPDAARPRPQRRRPRRQDRQRSR